MIDLDRPSPTIHISSSIRFALCRVIAAAMKQLLYLELPTPEIATVRTWLQQFQPALIPASATIEPTPDGIRLVAGESILRGDLARCVVHQSCILGLRKPGVWQNIWFNSGPTVITKKSLGRTDRVDQCSKLI